MTDNRVAHLHVPCTSNATFYNSVEDVHCHKQPSWAHAACHQTTLYPLCASFSRLSVTHLELLKNTQVAVSSDRQKKRFMTSLFREHICVSKKNTRIPGPTDWGLVCVCVCTPSNGESQNYQAPRPNRLCPSGLSAWEPWVPLQP